MSSLSKVDKILLVADSNMLAEPMIATIVLKKKRLHRRWMHNWIRADGLQPSEFNRGVVPQEAQDQRQIYRERSTEVSL